VAFQRHLRPGGRQVVHDRLHQGEGVEAAPGRAEGRRRRPEQGQQALDQLIHLVHVVDGAACGRMGFQFGQAHAQPRQRRAQVVRHGGEHEALGVEVRFQLSRQVVEHPGRLADLARAALLVELGRRHGDAHARRR
jgi:hypothetical protein